VASTAVRLHVIYFLSITTKSVAGMHASQVVHGPTYAHSMTMTSSLERVPSRCSCCMAQSVGQHEIFVAPPEHLQH
jgi:hypothetical protein